MSSPLVSVIVPIYKQTDYITETINSLVSQAYQNFEVIIVNALNRGPIHREAKWHLHSPVKNIYIEQHSTRAKAINAGIRASSGEIIAFLDANDRFLPEKLITHVAFFENYPNIDVTFSGYFIVTTLGLVLKMRYPPQPIDASDFIFGYPQTLSEIAFRRNSICDIGLFNENIDSTNDILDLTCRLVLAGCQFAGIYRSLNYHMCDGRYEPRNVSKDIDTSIHVLETAIRDSRCPREINNHLEKAQARIFLLGAYRAFIQREAELGQEFICKSFHLDRSILEMQANKFLKFVVHKIIDDGGEHESCLRSVFEQLPPKLEWISQYHDWAVAQGYIYRGVRDIIWGRLEDGNKDLSKAADMKARIDKFFFYQLLDQMAEYEEEFGYVAANKAIQDLSLYLSKVCSPSLLNWFNSVYFVNRAFRGYSKGQYSNVLCSVTKALFLNPMHFGNRGVLSILFRSIFRKQ